MFKMCLGVVIVKNITWIVLLILVGAVFIGVGIYRKGSGDSEHLIAVIPKETASVYWEGVRQGAQKAAAEEGFRISWIGPEIETDRSRQIQIVEDAITQRVAGIILAPNDDKALVPSVEKIYEKNIPCVIVDSGVQTDKYVAFLATDNYAGGVIAAQRMGKILGGKGKIVIVKWTPNSASTDNRAKGFIDTIDKEFDGIEIVDIKYPEPPTVARAREVTEDMMTSHPGINGLFACNATTAAGALQALRGAGEKGKAIKMVGFDAWEMLVKGLIEGAIDSLVIQNPYKMGYDGVKAIVAALNGRQVIKHQDTGVELVTKDRLDEPEIRALINLQ